MERKMSEPLYVVRATKFVAVDETGPDWLGSDEPYWVFSARVAGGTNTSRSKVFGDVDSGDTGVFDAVNGRNVVWPRRGATTGAAGPIGLSIQLWEADGGDPDSVAKKTELAFELAGHAPLVGDWVRLVPGIVRNEIAKLAGDDLIGSRTILFPSSLLRKRLAQPGASLALKYRLGTTAGDLPLQIAGAPDYDLYLTVTRIK
jgi:hypothetical protein